MVEEQVLYRKISWRLLPFLFLLFVVAYLDRINISFAKLQMGQDLRFSDTVYGIGAGIFFIGYFFFEVPSNLLLHRFGAKRWLARIIIVWGLVSMAMIWVDSVTSFYLFRFFLGVGEAGFFPGVIYYLTFWYPSTRRTQTVSLFLLAIPATGIVGSVLSAWIMQAFDQLQGLRGWQWLFLLEGVPAILLGGLCFWLLEDHPEQVGWLTTEEKQLLQRQLAQERQSATEATQLSQLIRLKAVWQLAVVYFLLASGLYGISFWLPQIIRDFGRSDLVMVGVLTAVPYFAAIVGMMAIAIHSDKTQERYWHLLICTVSTGMGFILSAVFQHHLILSLLSFSLATLGVLSSIAVFWSYPTRLLSGRVAAGGIALINSIGGLGGYLGPVLLGWVKDKTQLLESGLLCLALTQALAALLIARCLR